MPLRSMDFNDGCAVTLEVIKFSQRCGEVDF